MRNLLLIFALLGNSTLTCLAQEPYKLGVQENVPGSINPSYPVPQMMAVPATPIVKKAKKPLSAATSQNNNHMNANVASEVFSSGISKVALPPAFLGAWQVHGQRTVVDAQPEFQAAAQQAFSLSNDQIWNISGGPGGYTLGSNTGISTALIIDKVQGNTAYVRYQHPVGNTMAQEAIVMSLRPGGSQFDGLERISIIKQGLAQPRAKVTYQLVGSRQ